MTVTRVAPILLAVLVLTGCGSKSSQSGSPGPTTPDCAASRGALTPRTSPALEQRGTAFLTNVSVEALECIDRVVFEFKKTDPGPGFKVSYEPESTAKIEDGSGAPLAVAGAAFLVVHLTPAMTAEISGDQVTPTYTGPKRIAPPDTAHFTREVVKTGDFESVVTWAIGVDVKRPFTATASDTQLVIEIG